jgi:hypothetical protein
MNQRKTIIGFGVLLTEEEWHKINHLWDDNKNIVIDSYKYKYYYNFNNYFLCDPIVKMNTFTSSRKFDIENRLSHQILTEFCKTQKLNDPSWYVFVEVY